MTPSQSPPHEGEKLRQIKAIIFDWGRTLFDSDNKIEFSESEEVLRYCQEKGLRMGIASLVSSVANANLEERIRQIENSPLRKYFEIHLVTDTDKDKLFDQIVDHFGLPRQQVLIVDDRTVRGIRYGNRHGHPTIWLQKGKFAHELPDDRTGLPSHQVSSLKEILSIV